LLRELAGPEYAGTDPTSDSGKGNIPELLIGLNVKKKKPQKYMSLFHYENYSQKTETFIVVKIRIVVFLQFGW
jgi:hypothetical protein